MVKISIKFLKTTKRGDAYHFISADKADNYHTKYQPGAVSRKNRTEKGQRIKKIADHSNFLISI
ncbi:hypothetical protein QUF90_27090 [Desulfococcaceae bacterium HSG9]|nr:hypothetical protein [Desulfococcaceae bacterium HSG9]